MRVNKFLSDNGICSRRAADKLVEEGRVLINGITAVMGQNVADSDIVFVDGKEVQRNDNKVILAFNKPVGVTVSEKDEHAETLICDIIDYPVRLTYAGRLDKDSEGLILLTNDGDFINHIMRAANMHEKEYQVTLNRPVSDEEIDILAAGVYIKEFERKTRPCVIKRLRPDKVSMILTEGMNRQIRRMWKLRGANVVKLKRIRIVNINLDDLKPGKWREIKGEEKTSLYKMIGMKGE